MNELAAETTERSSPASVVEVASSSSMRDRETLPVVETPRQMPDIATGRADVPGPLDLVGMSKIEVVLQLEATDGTVVRTPARVDASVNVVDPRVKGIHMSRLYLLLQAGFDAEPFGPRMLEGVLRACVDSHEGTSTSSRIATTFEHVVRRSSLLSEHSGWRAYPVRTVSELRDGRVQHEVTVEIAYSSTCPCSAALSRQLLQEGFDRRFGGRSSVPSGAVRDWLGTKESIAALPHAQRSHASVTVVWEEGLESFEIERVIDIAERAVATPVQAVVKRVDEQEFARLNAENLMFCEDAARRLRAALEATEGIVDYRIAVEHLESLHPHDAVAVVAKGVPGGLRP